MREVQLQPLEAGIAGTRCGGDEIVPDPCDVVEHHGTRYARQIGAEGDGRRGDRLPGARIAFRNMVVTLPRTLRARLAPGVADLDAGHGAVRFDRRGDLRQSGRLFVVPKAEAGRRDAPFGRDGGRFDDQQAGAAACEAGVVGVVPVVGQAVAGAVLTHWRDHNTVA